MQDNVITLSVDELNDANMSDHVFERIDSFSNRSVYHGESHNLVAVDKFSLYRSYPKVSGNFRGVGKTSVKFTKDYAVTGVDGLAALTSPIIAEVSFSVPVGVSEADQLIIRQRLIAILDDDDVMVSLMNSLVV